MANPFVKAWNYLMQFFDSKIEEHADPKIELQQVIEQAQRKHQALTQQAAKVIGHQRQIEMQLNRQLGEIEKLNINIRQAITLADKARANGDESKAADYERTAEQFAIKLETVERTVEQNKTTYKAAQQQALEAKQQVEASAKRLQETLNKRSQMLSQIEQTKMQEQIAKSVQSMNALTANAGPSLDRIQEKIEARYAKALGTVELVQDSPAGRMLEFEHSQEELAGHARLEAIREQMRAEKNQPLQSGTSGQPSIEQASGEQFSSARKRIEQIRRDMN